MGGSRKKLGQKKVENDPQTFRDELISVKKTIADLQTKWENSIKSNENLRCLNTLLVNDLKMEQESKKPFMLAFQVRNFFKSICAHFREKELYQTEFSISATLCDLMETPVLIFCD